MPGINHVEHFIVLMLENRSYDHMLGDMSGPGLVGNEASRSDSGARAMVRHFQGLVEK